MPLIRPEELAGLARGRQILIVPEGRPVFEEVVPFFKRDDWRGGRSPRTRIAGQGAKPGRRCLALGGCLLPPPENTGHNIVKCFLELYNHSSCRIEGWIVRARNIGHPLSGGWPSSFG
ncbi:hypothetical protein STVA_24750 [Allostella vacuolata]|nr:hypothetical protein STVA_24750 [Stella vacuolata]